MAQIFKINNIQAFLDRPIFRKFSSCVEGSLCVVLPSLDGLENCLKERIINDISLPEHTDQESTSFIQDYTAFIASLNISNQANFLWWATDISSKNRYVCPLPDLIQELCEIDKAFQQCSGKSLLIIAPSMGIYGALRKLSAKYKRELSWPGVDSKVLQETFMGGFKSLRRLFLNAGRFYARSLWARIFLWQYARRVLLKNKEYYVIKTFSYPSSWDSNGEYSDSFFGRLPRFLSKDKNVLILSYHWQGYREFIKSIFREKTLIILPVEFFIKGTDVLKAIFRILTFRVKIDKEISFRGMDISEIVCYELARTNNGVQIFQLLHYDAMCQMFKKIGVGTFLFTFENNPWERMCILACRDQSPSTKVVGCQHSVVPQAALNMFVHPLEKSIVPLPSLIVTTGEIPQQILQYYGDYSQASVKNACALRYEYLSETKHVTRPISRGNILLVLDGVEQTWQMLKFVLEQLGGHNHYKLRIRCHPALPWSLIVNKFRFGISQYANIDVSKDALKEDLAWSDMIIYWQTTVVLEAMNFGKPVINFKTKDILSYDPLFQSEALKWTVTEKHSLVDVIAEIENMDEFSYQTQRAEALIYINRYFYPTSLSVLEFFRFDS